MKVLVIGGGAREHAVLWALSRSARRPELVCLPGNGGIAALARCIPETGASVAELAAAVAAEQPDFVVVGPEQPLAAGLVDLLRGRGIRVFGPTQAAAQLESSKVFAKQFMRRHGIPTAHSAVASTLDQARGALEKFSGGVVVKADGLAAGKGVAVCETAAEALAAAEEIFAGGRFGSAAAHLLIEERLYGPEVSFFALCDGRRAIPFALAQDHKRIGEGDTGPNTGGMGAYSTDDLLSPATAAYVLGSIAQRTVDGMRAEETPFTGMLFIGLMLTADGPKVLEFNTRFGDPETEAIVPRLASDLLDLLEACVDERLEGVAVKLRPGAGASVALASGGYPNAYTTGYAIAGLDRVPVGVEVFHSGTAAGDQEGVLVTAGGRVVVVSAAAGDLSGALAMIYGAIEPISFKGMQFRRDIGAKPLVGG